MTVKQLKSLLEQATTPKRAHAMAEPEAFMADDATIRIVLQLSPRKAVWFDLPDITSRMGGPDGTGVIRLDINDGHPYKYGGFTKKPD